MQGIPVADSKTPAWYAARNSGFGASEIAAVAGLSQYQTPYEVFLRKTGQLPEFGGNDSTRLGTKLEPIIVSEFTEETGIKAKQYPCPMLRHPRHSFLYATPDALLETDEVLECKATGWRIAKDQYGDDGTDDIPTEHLCQAQLQLEVTGLDVAHLACLVDGRHLRLFVVRKNVELIDRLIYAAAELWSRIQKNDPPAPDWGHESTLGVIKTLYGSIDDGKIVTLSAEARDAWSRYEDLGKEEKAAKEQREKEKARVLAEIGDAAAGDLGDGRVVRRKEIPATTISYERKAFIDARAMKLDSWMKG